MDVDFHYHATYLAARLAGFPHKRALTIGSAAQMVDENSYRAVKDSGFGEPHTIPIVGQRPKTVVHKYVPLATFFAANVAEQAGKGDLDRVASVWCVYHFPPGNFDVSDWFQKKYYGSAKNAAALWQRRTWGGEGTAPKEFSWLNRPKSPMSIFMVNNCREFVHAPPAGPNRNIVSELGLADYLIGVTSHVLADTWAHQDFTGPPGKVNTLRDSAMWFAYPKQTDYQKLEMTSKLYNPLADDQAFTEGSFRPLDRAPNWESFAIGHGTVGHWPDHSALMWKFTPAWSAAAITRNNPVEYIDAFLHLVEALRCIRTNETYRPFALTPMNITGMLLKINGACRGQGFGQIGWGTLSQIAKVLWLDRGSLRNVAWNELTWHDGLIDEEWDAGIKRHGRRWQELETQIVNQQIPEWDCGNSPWVKEAQMAVSACEKLGGIPAHRFRNMKYFKFNYAAKLHYRSMKEQLKAFGQELIGHWNDGSAYVDDHLALGPQERWRVDARTILTASLDARKDQRIQEELVVLLQLVDEAATMDEFKQWIVATRDDTVEEHKGVVDKVPEGDKSLAAGEIAALLAKLNYEGSVATAKVATDVAWFPSPSDFVDMTDRGFFTARDSLLKKIDAALEAYVKLLKEKATAPKLSEAAALVHTRCKEWLASGEAKTMDACWSTVKLLKSTATKVAAQHV